MSHLQFVHRFESPVGPGIVSGVLVSACYAQLSALSLLYSVLPDIYPMAYKGLIVGSISVP